MRTECTEGTKSTESDSGPPIACGIKGIEK